MTEQIKKLDMGFAAKMLEAEEDYSSEYLFQSIATNILIDAIRSAGMQETANTYLRLAEEGGWDL